jgi:prevent-host-death family protein
VIVNIHEAKTHLSRLVERAAAGEEIIIAKSGKPMARLTGVDIERIPRTPGSSRGRIRMADDFDSPLPERLKKLWFGKLTRVGSASRIPL